MGELDAPVYYHDDLAQYIYLYRLIPSFVFLLFSPKLARRSRQTTQTLDVFVISATSCSTLTVCIRPHQRFVKFHPKFLSIDNIDFVLAVFDFPIALHWRSVTPSQFWIINTIAFGNDILPEMGREEMSRPPSRAHSRV